MARPKVIVTGGAGYIGSHTCVELIRSGYDPVIVDDFRNSHSSVIDGIRRITGRTPELEELDCTDHDRLSLFLRSFRSYDDGIFGVIHFAAYKSVRESMSEPLKYYQNNVGSLISVIRAMSDNLLRKLVFSSSCTVYGQPGSNPVTEASIGSPPTSPYGSTKAICERIISDMGPALEPTVLRYFNPIGAHPSSLIGELPIGAPTNLVPLIAQAASGSRGLLTVFGEDQPTEDGTCVRDYIHVMDIARAHVLALQAKPTTVNLGLGFGTSVRQIIERFEAVNGVSVPHAYGPRQDGDVAEVWCAPDKAMADLGWEPELTVDDALRDAWNWQKQLDGVHV